MAFMFVRTDDAGIEGDMIRHDSIGYDAFMEPKVFVITHGIFAIGSEALTRSERLCYSARHDDTAADRTQCGALPHGASSAGQRVDRCRAALGGREPAAQGREPAAQGGGGERAASTADVAELLAASVPRREAQPGRTAQAEEARTAVWACAPDAGVGSKAGPDSGSQGRAL